ncbi:hypothetical protein [Paracoccus siganidrum]|uniref:Uncharacterized protein n=1 Tax=Paracoccus siganidrum TaxID=1276757 RepID=A0A419A7V3_9RHOB|nr:hypothetical protein [Paracoccus siganidrum]RJL17989.1 hypothetical protein D3P05_08430 [Paracoccus siganidrum]RMC40981.1 hypothetical protein C9E82_00095 [Paracoccus siganidrum]
MATYEDLIAAARQADANGNTDDARRLLEMAVALRDNAQPSPAQGMAAERPLSQQLVDQYKQAEAAGDYETADRLLSEASYAATQDGTAPASVAYNPRTGRMEDMDLRRGNGRLDAAAQGFGQGISFGTMDEAVGAMYGMTGPGTYEQNRDYALASMRSDLASARENHPIIAYGSEIGGGALSSLGGASALGIQAAPTIGGRVVQGGIMGGIEGLGYGYATGEGIEDRAGNAAKGLGFGLTLGTAAPFAIEGGRRAIDHISGPFASMRAAPSQVRASRAVQSAVDRSGRSLDEIDAAIRQAGAEGQPMYSVADATGYSGQRMLAGAARTPGAARQEIIEHLASRQDGQARRLGGFLDDALNSPRNAGNLPAIPGSNPADFTGMTAEQVRGQLTGARSRAANVAYDAARRGASPVDVRGALAAIDDRIGPMQGSGVAGDGIDAKLTSYRARLTSQPGGASYPGASSVELSDFDRVLGVKQAIQDDIGAALRAGRNNEARELGRVAAQLDEALEAASPAYRQANDQFAQASRVIDQIDAGRAATGPRARVENTLSAYGALTPDQQAAFRSGYSDPLMARLENSAPGVNNARPLTSEGARAELGAMSRDPALLQRQIARENDMFRTANAASGGSMTADNLADAADLSAMSMSPIINALTGNFGAAARQTGDAVLNALSGRNTATREEIARLLLSSDIRNALAPALQAQAQALPIMNAFSAFARSGERVGNPY